jgi:hypothetical protein
MGAIVIRTPASSIAGTALHELDTAIQLFAIASSQLRNGRHVQVRIMHAHIPFLLRLAV